MKRRNTIGFDARHADIGDEALGAYSRYVVAAMAEAYPRYCYFRLYAPHTPENEEYRVIAEHQNVETMLPDGSLWRALPKLWHGAPIARDMARGDVDLYHSLTPSLPYGLAGRNIRSVVTVHSLDFLRLRGLSNTLTRHFRRIALSETLRRADRIVAVSQCVKRDIVHLLHVDSDKIDVIYTGCHARFNTEPTTEELADVREKYNLPTRYILFRGTQYAHKNLSLIIEALRYIDSDVHLVCVGRATSHTEHVLHRIKSLGLERRVHMIYGAEESDVPAIYHLATLFVLPSRYEGFATEIVEAITSGVPVIAARGSSLEEAGGPHSIYLSATERDEWVRAINSLLEDEEMRTEMARLGREHATRFRAELTAYNLQNCYRRIGVDILG